jgi:hypothetical protein
VYPGCGERGAVLDGFESHCCTVPMHGFR